MHFCTPALGSGVLLAVSGEGAGGSVGGGVGEASNESSGRGLGGVFRGAWEGVWVRLPMSLLGGVWEVFSCTPDGGPKYAFMIVLIQGQMHAPLEPQ